MFCAIFLQNYGINLKHRLTKISQSSKWKQKKNLGSSWKDGLVCPGEICAKAIRTRVWLNFGELISLFWPDFLEIFGRDATGIPGPPGLPASRPPARLRPWLNHSSSPVELPRPKLLQLARPTAALHSTLSAKRRWRRACNNLKKLNHVVRTNQSKRLIVKT